MTPEDFISSLSSAARISMKSSRIPASFVIAEGALESEWGDSMLCQRGMNIFGVKADDSWKGETIAINTREFLHGQWVMVPALWRKYQDWLSCIQDHAAFLTQNQRYKPAFEYTDDAEAFTHAIAAAGYATDPNYASKIISIIRLHKLTDFDN